MEYIISEEELKKIFYEGLYVDEVRNFFKDKQPAELVAKGIVKTYPSGIEIGKHTLENVNEKIIDNRGNNIKIYIQKVKE